MTIQARTALAVLLTCLAAAPALADDTKRLGKSGEWEGYAFTEGKDKVCYTAAPAGKLQGGEKGKNGVTLIITHRASAKGEVSVTGASPFKKDSDVELQVGGTKHTLFTKGANAWAKDAAADKAIVAALLKGKEVSVRATPAKGTAITGTVPLAGFKDALAAIDKACAVKR